MVKYMGGKHRLGKKIAGEIAQDFAKNRRPLTLYNYWEPFFGAGSVLKAFKGMNLDRVKQYVASDVEASLMRLWRDVCVFGWKPPSEVSEELYQELKESYDAGERTGLHAFVGIFCSYGGKLWGGYARDAKGTNYAAQQARTLDPYRKRRNYADEAARDLKATVDKGHFEGVMFFHGDYKEVETYLSRDLRPYIIYCDPPYLNTTGYRGVSFDHDEFWSTLISWSKVRENHYGGLIQDLIYVSEYTVPDKYRDNVELIASFPTKTTLVNEGVYGDRVEKLFKVVYNPNKEIYNEQQ